MSELAHISGDGIRCDLSDRILTITFDRPHVLNAFSYSMLTGFRRALVFADAHADVGAVIVTGNGRAFSAGTDISADPDGFEQSANGGTQEGHEPDFGGVIALQMFMSSKPIIAAVNGAAVGFGSTMVLPMDLRIASTSAYFSYIFTRRGLMPEACSTWFLPRVVGITRALDWSLSGRKVPAEEAMAAGLVTEVVDGDRLLARARDLTSALIQRTSPTSLAVCRRAMWSMLMASGPEVAHRLESAGMSMLRGSDDFLEALQSFREKRSATFGLTTDAKITREIGKLIENI